MLFKFIYQSWARQKRYALLILLVLTLGGGASLGLVYFGMTVEDKILSDLRSYGANIVVTPLQEENKLEIGGMDFTPLQKKSFLLESELPRLKQIFWKNNILNFAPYLYAQAHRLSSSAQAPLEASLEEKDKKGNPRGNSLPLAGTWFQHPLHQDLEKQPGYFGVQSLYPWWKIEGRYPHDQEEDPSMTEGLMGTHLAKQQGIHVGDTLTLSLSSLRHDIKIVGLITTGGKEESELLLPLTRLQAWMGLHNKIQKIYVSALTTPESTLLQRYGFQPAQLDSVRYERWYCTPYPSSIAYQIQENLTQARAEPLRQITTSESIFYYKIKKLLGLFLAAVLLISVLGLSTSLSTVVWERRQEWALLKILGAEKGQVFLFFGLGLLGLTLVGSILGVGTGYLLGDLLSRKIFGITVSFNPSLFWLAFLIAGGTVAIASFLPLYRIFRLFPQRVLHE